MMAERFRFEVEESMDDYKYVRVLEVKPCPHVSEQGRWVEVRQYCKDEKNGLTTEGEADVIMLNPAVVKDLARFLAEVSA